MSLLSARFNRLSSLFNQPSIGNLVSSLGSLRLSSRSQKLIRPRGEPQPQPVVRTDVKDESKSVFQNVNNLLASQNTGRLFAVVQLCGKQFKVTSGDIILVEGYWPPTIGDRIRLEKVLLVGGNDFTLIGRPILEPGLADIEATIIEKTLTHTKTHFKKKRRKQYTRINFQRSPNTMIRINSIEVAGQVNEPNREANPRTIF